MTDWITTKITAEWVRGAIELEDTGRGLLPHRLPAWARAQIPDVRLTIAEAQPAGMRLVFRTDATTLELDTLQTKRVYVGAPEQPSGTFTLVVDGRVLAHTSVPGGNTPAGRPGDGRSGAAAGFAWRCALPRAACRRQDRRDLVAAQRADRAARAADRRAGRASAGGTPGVAAPRQFDQPRLQRRRTD